MLLWGSASFAQNEVDALRYSTTGFYGTARYMSMGGAFGALGADFSTLSTNPAGIAMFNSSEISVTPFFDFSTIKSNYNGEMMQDSDERIAFSNVGIVLAQNVSEAGGSGSWKNFQFGFGLNRLKSFNNNYLIEGVNNDNSMADVYASLADGINFEVIADDEFGEFAFDLTPAYWTWLIDTINGPDHYTSSAPTGPISQKKMIDTWGSMSEIVMAFGANYEDRFYIGASFGFPYIRYSSRSTYTETKLNKDVNPSEFREFELKEDLNTRGTGFNFKIGMILRPTNWIRIGGAFHTPTYYTNITDEWSNSFFTRFDTPDSHGNYTYYESSPIGNYDYDLRTPMKAMGSIALIIGTYGLISADYEYVDYSKAKLSAPDYDFITENDAITQKYTSAHNIRLGTEWRYGPFSIRGGYATYGSPFDNDVNDGSRKFYSLGLGYRERSFFVDLAYIHEQSDEDYYLYGTGNIIVNPTTMDKQNDNFALTLGLRF